MKFRVICERTSHKAQSPFRVVERDTGREVDWINQYLDREAVRCLSENSLRVYADELLYFVRWWASIHHTAAVTEGDLNESTLLEYVRFQHNSRSPPLRRSIIALPLRNARCAMRFLTLPCRVARGFHQPYPATQADGPRQTTRGDQPLTGQSAQTQHRAAIGAGGITVLIQLSHVA